MQSSSAVPLRPIQQRSLRALLRESFTATLASVVTVVTPVVAAV
jgi:hypothetical protein